MRALAGACLLALLACASPFASAGLAGSDASRKLVAEGNSLVAQRRYQEALDKFEAAGKDSPEASGPLSAAAYTLYTLAAGSTDPKARAQVERALGMAQRALMLAPEDPLANEVLRLAGDADAPPPYQANKAASDAFLEGESLFHQARYEEARKKYRESRQLDPKFTSALVMEGDTYYMERNWTAAELLFRMATDAEPADPQGWRFLADTLAAAGDLAGAEQAALRAVLALPSQKGSWDRLNWLGQGKGHALQRLALTRKAWATLAAGSREVTLSVSDEFKDKFMDKDADYAAWGVYALSQLGKGAGAPATESALQKEVRCWSAALAAARDVEAAGHPGLRSPDLQNLRKLQDAGQLDTAIMLLMYREAFRPQLEAWYKADPNGLPKFIEAWHLMP